MAAAKAEKGQVYAFRKKVAAVFEGGKTNEGELKQNMKK